MVDQIVDKREVCIPGPKGDVTPEAIACQQAAEQARDISVSSASNAQTAARQAEEAMKDRVTLAQVKPWMVQKRFAHVVCIGDSWGEGYYAGAKHPGQGWPERLREKLSMDVMENKCVSASGWLNNGDSLSFPAQWDSVADKSSVDLVVIAGGQNDAASRADLSQLDNVLAEMLQRIGQQAPKAEIHVFPMLLAYGTTLTVKQNWEQPIPTARRIWAYSQIMKTAMYARAGGERTMIHDGCYRWGTACGKECDTGDGAHLTAGGYAFIGHLMAQCISHRRDWWPTFESDYANSQIDGNWRWAHWTEAHGTIRVSSCVDYSDQNGLTNGKRVTAVPDFARPSGESRYFRPAVDTNNGQYFLAVDPNGMMTIQGAQGFTPKTGIMVIDQSWPAGF
jgi:lysophospholipase L1-like esterase